MKNLFTILMVSLVALSGCNTTTTTAQAPVSTGPEILSCSVKNFTQSGEPDLEFQRKNRLKKFKIDLSETNKITVYTFSKEFRDSTQVYAKRSDTGSFFTAVVPKRDKFSFDRLVKIKKAPDANGIFAAEISVGAARSGKASGFKNTWFLACNPQA